MEKKLIQNKILRKLMSMKPPKWGNSHTEEKNLVKENFAKVNEIN